LFDPEKEVSKYVAEKNQDENLGTFLKACLRKNLTLRLRYLHLRQMTFYEEK
jgi:hypothetical protein